MTSLRRVLPPIEAALWIASLSIALIAWTAGHASAAGTDGVEDAHPEVTVASAAAPGAHPISGTALSYVGSVQGQCFPWVRRVVAQATGARIGFSYRSGFLEAGASEVTLPEARAGDIIQLANDADTSPNADYPGLHTSIVLNNYGGGLFRVVDSNADWDGLVQVRDQYDPLGLASRYAGISARVYRFPGGAEIAAAAAATPGQPPAPSTPGVALNAGGGSSTTTTALAAALPGLGAAALPPGASGTATVRGDGDCLRMRGTPGLAGGILTCLPDGSTVTVLPRSQLADGIEWQFVAAAGTSGWVANRYLEHDIVAGSAPPPPAAPAPAPPAATPEPTSTPAPASTPAPTPVAGAPTITADTGIIGDVPTSGGLGLIVFGGGSVESLVAAAASRGCPIVSVWANKSGGGLVGLIWGAPAQVNGAWEAQFQGAELAPRSPVIIVCQGNGPALVSQPRPAPSGAPGSGPPGPAGNEP